MTSLPKPDVILTHESDLDGLVAGSLLQRLARQLFQVEVPVEAYHYQTWKQRTLREGSAWVADLSFETRLDRPNWVVIDHHTTEGVPQKAKLIHDVRKSAGLLCYELCQEHGLGTPTLDRLVHLNNVADLFLESDPDFSLANDYASLVKVYQFWNLWNLIGGQIERLLDHPLLEVMATKRRVEDPLGLAWSRDNIQQITPEVGVVETVVGNTNAIVHQLLDQKVVPYPVLVTLFKKANNQIIVSLRSRNGQALKVAERLQGGGHPNASGAALPKSVKSVREAMEYLRFTLAPPASVNTMENLFGPLDLKL